jgi:Holliday junction resolvase
MPTNYERGRTLEYRVIGKLREAGYFAVRSAGSKGAVDIAAIKPGQVLFVQCKLQQAAVSSAEWNTLVLVAAQSGAIPVLAEAEPRGPVRWWRLTGPKRPRQRNGLPRQPFLIDFANDPLITAQSPKEIGEQI